MTKEEAINMLTPITNKPHQFLNCLQALGIIKFDTSIQTLYNENFLQWGVIRIEQWPEGLVISVGGEIRYKSFKEFKGI